jgi:hypothetical protein
MPGEVIEKTGNTEQAFKEGGAMDELKDFEYRKNELASGKEDLKANIDKMNKRLAKSLDFFPFGQDTLSQGELKMAIEFTDKELNNLENKYKAKIEGINQEFKATPFTREANIIDAIQELNSGLEGFLVGRLETIISEADMADEDRNAMIARLYPKAEPKYGEQEVAAIGKHFRDLDEAANMK